MEYFEVLKYLLIQLILTNKMYMEVFEDLKQIFIPFQLKIICIWNNLDTSNYSKFYCFSKKIYMEYFEVLKHLEI